MRRRYADLHIRMNPKDSQLTKPAIDKAAKMGYCSISFPFNEQFEENQAAQLRNACASAGIDFVLRADFKPRNQEDLMRFLRKYRRKLEIICVICDNKEIARQAAKDHRVDILNFPSLDYRKRFFDRAEAELAINTQTALEIDVKPLLVLEGPPRVRLLSNLRRETSLAREFHVPIMVSSGISELQLMRMPRDMASLGYLFGLSEEEALEAVSSNATEIVARNREKQSSTFIAPGVRLVKAGNDD